MALHISFEVDEGSWDAAAADLADWTRPVAPWQEPIERSCADAGFIGPEGYAWFQLDSTRIEYRGSLLHLACALNEWLSLDPEVYTIEPDLVYQSAAVELRRVGDAVEVTLPRIDREDAFRSPRDEVRRAVTKFLAEFGGAIVARLPGLRGVAGLGWLPEPAARTDA